MPTKQFLQTFVLLTMMPSAVLWPHADATIFDLLRTIKSTHCQLQAKNVACKTRCGLDLSGCNLLCMI